MELELSRIYFTGGTNGVLYNSDQFICKTIELPWKDNRRNISCIPEGRYELIGRHSLKFGQHLHVQNVPGRQWILIHPANNAALELQGCIAPVTMLTGPGKGTGSVQAMERLKMLASVALSRNESIYLTIKKLPNEAI